MDSLAGADPSAVDPSSDTPGFPNLCNTFKLAGILDVVFVKRASLQMTGIG